MQARISKDDPRFYNVNRDIAHCFGGVAREVAARLEDERWPVLTAYLKEHDVTMDQLGEVCKAFCEFAAGTCDDPDEDMGDTLTRVGWWKVPEPAQVALLSIVGTVMMGYFYRGARDVTIGFDGPCASLQDLRMAGSIAHEYMMAPWWKRWWWHLFGRKKKYVDSRGTTT